MTVPIVTEEGFIGELKSIHSVYLKHVLKPINDGQEAHPEIVERIENELSDKINDSRFKKLSKSVQTGYSCLLNLVKSSKIMKKDEVTEALYSLESACIDDQKKVDCCGLMKSKMIKSCRESQYDLLQKSIREGYKNDAIKDRLNICIVCPYRA